MTLRSLGLPALLLALMGATASAGDPFPGAATGTSAGGMPCRNCEKHGTRAGSDCPTCLNGKYGIGWKKRPTVPTLAPGACFGYFPTQWNKWQDVCPIPYPGAGISDPATTSTAARKKEPKADPAPEPRPAGDDPAPADPTKKGSDLPVEPKAKGTEPPADPSGKGTELPKPAPKLDGPSGPRGASSGLPMPVIPTAPPTTLPPIPGKF